MTIIAEKTAGDPFFDKKKPVAQQVDRQFKSPQGTIFRISDKGVFVVTFENDQEEEVLLCGRLVVLTEFVSNSGDLFSRQVEFTDNYGMSHQLLIPKGDIMYDVRRVCSDLVARGFQWYSFYGRLGYDYLKEYLLHAPVDLQQPGILVSDYGWYELGTTFVLSDGHGEATIIGKPERPLIFRRTGGSHGPKYARSGTLTEWMKSSGTLARYSTRCAFYVSASFAGALLDFLPSIESAGFHLAGSSSTGKSTVMRMSSTVWGPYGHQGDVTTWRSTANGDEAAAAEHSGSVLYLDELHEAERSTLVQRIYQLGNAVGKNRQSVDLKAQPRLTWSVLVLSSGEFSVKEFLAQGNIALPLGAEVRLATVRTSAESLWDRLPAGDLRTAEELTLAAADAGAKFYGTAGPEFLHRLIDNVSSLGGAAVMSEHLAEKVQEWTDAYVPFASGQVRRVGRRFGLVAVAGELAIEYGILPWKPGDASTAVAACFQSFIEQFEDPELRQERMGMLPIECVVTWPHHFRFFNPGATKEITDPKEQSPVFGYVYQSEQGVDRISPAIIFFTPQGVSAMCGKEVQHEVLAALKQAGRLLVNEGTRLTYKPSGNALLGVVPAGVRYVAVYCLKGYSEELKKALSGSKFGKKCIQAFEHLATSSKDSSDT